MHFTSRGARTFFGGVEAGSSVGTELPQIERFQLGGLLSLLGFAEGELSGQHFVSARAGRHQRIARLAPALGRGIYVGAWIEAAHVSERWRDLAAAGVMLSGTIVLGADTAL